MPDSDSDRNRRHPTAGFWLTVALIAVLAYPLSFGPACWISSRVQPSARFLTLVYYPVLWAWADGPDLAGEMIGNYANLGLGDSYGIAEAGHLEISFFRR